MSAQRYAAIALIVALSACAQTNFYPAPPGPAIQGTGGPTTSVEDYPVWAVGATPARRYTVIGEVEIKDNNSWKGIARLNEALAGTIREAKGDGAITISSPRNATALIGGKLEPALANIVERYAIIRYVD